jgi:hypothetical protein
MTPASVNGVFEAAVEISRARLQTLALLRQALEQGRTAEALKLARSLAGLE